MRKYLVFYFYVPILAIVSQLVCINESMAEEKKVYLFPSYTAEREDIYAESPPRPSARYGQKLPVYAPKILETLKKNRSPSHYLEQVMILEGVEGQDYLLVKWAVRRDWSYQTVEIHKIIETPESGVRLQFVREIEDNLVSIKEPTGKEVFPGEPTVAVIEQGSGGSGAEGYWINLIQMKRNTVDITPRWAGKATDLVDLNDDGIYEFVANDQRWANFFIGCGACGPHIPVVLRRENGEFIPACKDFSDIYKKDIAALIDFIKKEDTEIFRWQYIAEIALKYAQIGEIAEAKNTYEWLLNEMESTESPDAELIKAVQKHIGDTIFKSQEYHDVSCPLAATSGSGSHIGYERRVESFVQND